ncbi:MAG: gliding motility protein RemB, partial [Flavobacteriales bacterium]|nr:gliding motility protein RemB [Flavobacteriales bacterium]
SKGKELVESQNTFTNTRGYLIEGHLGKTISFATSFAENQSIFPNYLHENIKTNRIVAGQGYARDFKETGFDYAMSSGYVSYRANKMFAVQFGHGKHFIGDGYRSLLLSDNTFNYPYLRIQTTFGKVQYTNLYAELMDINYFTTHGVDNKDQMGYPKKYMSAHYLSINATKKLSFSLYEAIVWRMNHAPGSSGFDVNYLNPIAMLRPMEFSINSPDNVLVGLNTKYKLPFSSYLYGQLVLDEFSITDLRAENGFWANKIGYQLGYKMFDAFKVKNLTLQTEYNYVRPYTYAHNNPEQNYAHYNQPLAHPLGSNFSEFLFLAKYSFKRFEIDGKIMLAKYGGKVLNDPTSYGNDVYFSTGNYAEEEGLVGMGSGRPSDFGIEMYQGNLTTINYQSLNVSYIINPHTNLKFKLGVTLRDAKNDDGQMQTKFFNFGIMSDLFNHYYDI